MLDWKTRGARLRGRFNDSRDGVRSYLGGSWLTRGLVLVLVIFLLCAWLIGWYWSQEPGAFPVAQSARAAAERDQRAVDRLAGRRILRGSLVRVVTGLDGEGARGGDQREGQQ